MNMEVDDSQSAQFAICTIEAATSDICQVHTAMGRCFEMNSRETEAFHLAIGNLLINFFLNCSRDAVIRFLDNIDTKVEELRKEAVHLQQNHDELQTRIDLLKNTDFLSNLTEDEKEEINLHLQRINTRLQVSPKMTSRNLL